MSSIIKYYNINIILRMLCVLHQFISAHQSRRVEEKVQPTRET